MGTHLLGTHMPLLQETMLGSPQSSLILATMGMVPGGKRGCHLHDKAPEKIPVTTADAQPHRGVSLALEFVWWAHLSKEQGTPHQMVLSHLSATISLHIGKGQEWWLFGHLIAIPQGMVSQFADFSFRKWIF